MSLHADFSAMVAEMRPQWDAAEAKRCAVRADWFLRGKTIVPPRALTVDDYRAAVLRFDAAELMSEVRSEWLAATYQRDALMHMARTFDPDFAIWHELQRSRK